MCVDAVPARAQGATQFNAASARARRTSGMLTTAWGVLLATASARRGGADGRARARAQVLYFAEFDLQFFKTRSEMVRHLAKCRLQHPPGDEIYRNRTAKGGVSMYEVHARRPARAVPHPACRDRELRTRNTDSVSSEPRACRRALAESAVARRSHTTPSQKARVRSIMRRRRGALLLQASFELAHAAASREGAPRVRCLM
jgi:hypothetical protein